MESILRLELKLLETHKDAQFVKRFGKEISVSNLGSPTKAASTMQDPKSVASSSNYLGTLESWVSNVWKPKVNYE